MIDNGINKTDIRIIYKTHEFETFYNELSDTVKTKLNMSLMLFRRYILYLQSLLNI